jgi:hypothetical protein
LSGLAKPLLTTSTNKKTTVYSRKGAGKSRNNILIQGFETAPPPLTAAEGLKRPYGHRKDFD